jgi:hypothetical protein
MVPHSAVRETSMKLLFVMAPLALGSALLCAAQKSTEPVPVEAEPHHHTVLKNDFILVMHVNVPER